MRGATATTTAVTSRAPAATTSPSRASQVSGRTVPRRYPWHPPAPSPECSCTERARTVAYGRRLADRDAVTRSASTVPLRGPAVRARRRQGLGRAGPQDRGPRLRHGRRCPTTSPTSSPRCRRCRRPPTPRRRCASARSCSTTTTSTPSCWPRSWPRWTCCRDGRVEIGIGAGWMESDYRAAGMPYDRPGVRIDRFVEALAVIKGAMADGPFSFAGEHYTITDYDGLPKPVQRPHPPILIGGGGRRVLSIAAREADIVGINGTLTAGVIGPEAIATMTREAVVESVGDRPRGRRRPARRHRAEHPGVLRQRHRRPRRHAVADVAGVRRRRARRWSRRRRSPSIGSTATIADELVAPARGARLQLRHRRRRATSTPSPPSSPTSPAPDRTELRASLAVSGSSLRSFSITAMPSSLTVNRSRSSSAVEADAVPLGDVDVLVDDAAVQAGARADADAREQDRVGDVGVVVDVHARRRRSSARRGRRR